MGNKIYQTRKQDVSFAEMSGIDPQLIVNVANNINKTLSPNIYFMDSYCNNL